ncbi:MAG: hypothetical protein M5R36_07385 [Deltaproteobacteria bacterium]|nr:hypothetical protein [Deltaproteobacteria bacterium]
MFGSFNDTASLPTIMVALSSIFIVAAIHHSLHARGPRYTKIFFSAAFAHATIHEAFIQYMPIPDYSFGEHVLTVAGVSPLAVAGWVLVWYLSLHWAEHLIARPAGKLWKTVFAASFFGSMMSLTIEPAFQHLQILAWSADNQHPLIYAFAWFHQTLVFVGLFVVYLHGNSKARLAVAAVYTFYLVTDLRLLSDSAAVQMGLRIFLSFFVPRYPSRSRRFIRGGAWRSTSEDRPRITHRLWCLWRLSWCAF